MRRDGPVDLRHRMGNDVDDAMRSMIHALRAAENAACWPSRSPRTIRTRPDRRCGTPFSGGGIPVGGARSAREDGYIRQTVTAEDGGRRGIRTTCWTQAGRRKPCRFCVQPRPLTTAHWSWSVGLTCLARLLDSKPDGASRPPRPVAKKVRLLSTMAGVLDEMKAQRAKYNVVRTWKPPENLPSGQPRSASGWVQRDPASGGQHAARLRLRGPPSLREAYAYYRELENDQPTYDLTSVLYAVRPDQGSPPCPNRDGSRSPPTAIPSLRGERNCRFLPSPDQIVRSAGSVALASRRAGDGEGDIECRMSNDECRIGNSE